METVPPDKRELQRKAEDLLLQRIHAYWDAQGMTHSAPQALSEALSAVELPGALRRKDRRELGRLYRRVRRTRLPSGYDNWIEWVTDLDSSYDRIKARGLIDRLVAAAGQSRFGNLSKLFDHLTRQYSGTGRKKVARLEHECTSYGANDSYLASLASLSNDDAGDRVLKALDEPKTRQQLIKILGWTPFAVSTVCTRLKKGRKIKVIGRGKQRQWALSDHPAEDYVLARDVIRAALAKRPMNVEEIRQDTGYGTSTVQNVLRDQLKGEVTPCARGRYALAGTAPVYVYKRPLVREALEKNGRMSVAEIAEKIGAKLSTTYKYLNELIDNGEVTLCARGRYALAGTAPVHVLTTHAIISCLAKKPMKFGSLVQCVSRLQVTVDKELLRATVDREVQHLKTEGLVKYERRGAEYCLTPRGRARAKRLAG
jgi:DNA-binding IclR family transcriptional regulator